MNKSAAGISAAQTGIFRLPGTAALLVCLCLTGSLLGLAGCSSTKYATLRPVPKNPLSAQLNVLSSEGPQPTERTMQLLRRYDLVDDLNGEPEQLQEKLHEWVKKEPNAEHIYAVAELAYIGGLKKEHSDPKVALDLYGAAVMHAYLYLFDPALDEERNPYDPQYRGASDIYNTALESALRIERSQGVLRPGMTHTIQTASREIEVTCVLNGSGWHAEDFEHFEFVSDYEVAGLTNNYRTHGLGVPLIAVRQHHEDGDPAERYYPPKLSVPVTAFLRIQGQQPPKTPGGKPRIQAVLELCDPLSTADLQVANRLVPLESNLTTPLAYFLSQPELDAKEISTFGFLNPDQAQKAAGIYMLQPYQPGKIPVIMIHGLWSTPFTWMEMFNDLRSDPELREHYQFWFYMYPTGPPFWFSAAQMRTDLANLRQTLDPQRKEAALDEMVLVGHSMGGLVAKLQTVESGNDFWKVVSDHSFSELKAEPELREKIAQTLYFHPNPSVRRVITIATPHQGSDFANSTTSYLSHKLIMQPMQLMTGRNKLIADNPNFFHESSVLEIQTSIDSLSPKSPFLKVLYETPLPKQVPYHTIIGELPPGSFLRHISGTSDGVVRVGSAKLPGAESELKVPADHSHAHTHPRSVMEVRRILKEHLEVAQAEMEHRPVQFAQQPPSGQQIMHSASNPQRQAITLHDHSHGPAESIPGPGLPGGMAPPGIQQSAPEQPVAPWQHSAAGAEPSPQAYAAPTPDYVSPSQDDAAPQPVDGSYPATEPPLPAPEPPSPRKGTGKIRFSAAEE